MMVILSIFLCFLLLVAAFIFVPLHYRMKGNIAADAAVQINAGWFLRLLYVKFTYENHQTHMQFRVAGCWISDAKKKKKAKPIDMVQPSPLAKPVSMPPNSVPPVPEEPVRPYEAVQKPTRKQKRAAKKAQRQKIENKTQEGNRKKNKERKKRKKGLKDLLKQIEAVLTYPDRKIIMSLCFEYLQRALKAIKPKKIEIEGCFGLDDPSLTGVILGAYEAVAGISGLRHAIRLAPDFDKQILELKFDIVGKISLFSLLEPVLWLCIKKPVRELIKHFLWDGLRSRKVKERVGADEQ